MSKNISILFIISILFTGGGGLSGENIPESRDFEQKKLQKTLQEARKRILDAGTYRWNDALRFLPTMTLSRRAPHEEYSSPANETYLSASISFNQLFSMTEIADRRDAEKRKAIRKVESLAFGIEKLIERKHLVADQIGKMKKIARSLDDPLEAARKQERIDELEVKKNETAIEIERMFAEMEYVCVEVGR